MPCTYYGEGEREQQTSIALSEAREEIDKVTRILCWVTGKLSSALLARLKKENAEFAAWHDDHLKRDADRKKAEEFRQEQLRKEREAKKAELRKKLAELETED